MPAGYDRQRLRRIWILALPIVGGMVSQNVLNIVDTLMVSRLGPAALAGVGLGGFTTFMASAIVIALGVGVQVMAARRLGEGRHDELAEPLNGGLVLVALIAVPLSVMLILVVPAVYPFLSADPEVIEQGVPYLQARLVAMVAMGANFAFRGYWNGVNLSRLYLRTLVVMHLCNVGISYVLIFGALGAPALGALGAGIGTAASTFIGTAMYFWLASRYARSTGFLARRPSWASQKTLLRLSVPSMVQQILFASGLTAMFAIVARVGTVELAAANVLINVTLVAVLPGLGLGLAAASLVGQALGRGEPDDASRWGWEVAGVGMAALFVLGLPMLVLPNLILSPFFDDPDALRLAALPLRLVGGSIAIDGAGIILLHALMGAGATRSAMMVAVGAQWLVFLPLAYLIGPVLGYGLLGIWLAQIGYRTMQAVLCAALWRSRRWLGVAV
jgi:multidrug resistance protein, MATE family